MCLYDHLGMETHVRDHNLDIEMLVVKSMLKNAYDDFMGFYMMEMWFEPWFTLLLNYELL